jgi:hypothetical protein
MRDAGESASEMWDSAYQQGERYLQQGRQMVGQLDGPTLGAMAVAGAIGFGLAWLMFGQQFRSAADMTRRMSESSDRYRPENRGSRAH